MGQERNIRFTCIGNIKIKNPFVLAPMANFTDLAFRIQCRKYGAALAFTEMIDADGLFHNTYNIEKKILCEKKDYPLAAQIVGSNPKTLAFSAKLLEKKGADIIDINMGCPSFKLLKKEAGAKLLTDIKRISQIIKAVSGVINIPLSVKIRSGWNNTNDVEKIAKTIEKAGADAITIHARTGKMGFKGNADWEIIKKIKKSVHIPVIGNGDVTSPKHAFEMIEKTGCDFVMIGRAALGNPFIFKECIYYDKYRKILKSSSLEKKEALLELWNISKKYYKPEFKKYKHYSYSYTKNLRRGKAFRDKISQTKNLKELKELINKWLF